IRGDTFPADRDAGKPGMFRAAERLSAESEERMGRLGAFDDLRVEKGIPAVRSDGRGGRHLHTHLEPPGARDADIDVLALKRGGIRRDQRNDVAEAVVKIGQLELRAIVCDPLLDANFDAAGSLRLQTRVTLEEW